MAESSARNALRGERREKHSAESGEGTADHMSPGSPLVLVPTLVVAVAFGRYGCTAQAFTLCFVAAKRIMQFACTALRKHFMFQSDIWLIFNLQAI